MSVEIASLLILVLKVVQWVIIAEVLLSWVVRDPSNPIMRFLRTLTDPLLRPLRPFLTVGMFDLSPVAVILLLSVLQGVVARAAYGGY